MEESQQIIILRFSKNTEPSSNEAQAEEQQLTLRADQIHKIIKLLSQETYQNINRFHLFHLFNLGIQVNMIKL